MENENSAETDDIADADKGSALHWWYDTLRFLLLSLLIVLPIRFFIAQPFIVSGDSMVPTFESGDYLIIDELSFYFRNPRQDEVVVFRYPLQPSKYFIKRITGLPGEKIGNLTLGNDEYYVLGDNSNVSADSRVWGPLARRFIVGRALVRLIPIARAEVLPGQK